jgi:1,2-phenylacetyl-CoA epoxidase PaaB subunit
MGTTRSLVAIGLWVIKQSKIITKKKNKKNQKKPKKKKRFENVRHTFS